MKKLFYITLLIALPLSLAACQSKSTTGSSQEKSSSSKVAQKDSSDKQASRSSKSESSSSSEEKNSSSSEVTIATRDMSAIGIMTYQEQFPSDDLQKEPNLGLTKGAQFLIGVSSVSELAYNLDGDSVVWYTKENDNSKPESEKELSVKHTMSLAELEAKHYSTAAQKSLVDALVQKISIVDNDTSSNSDEESSDDYEDTDATDTDNEDTDNYDTEDDNEDVNTNEDTTDDYDE
ncbi:hypothetical protein FEZ51_06450 [Pediococcus stilesii]|uniref:Uncharacterized protein n=1 Tax=Pediococcus stilesii TaxID=331679 RepID=A0A5R9BVZ1_9LACO|nr:hypothetical protein [Pediococcus stilesii]TLQ04062.1 hypothetical protein FEZ51_06450 [Pediococcus stilesii]